MNRDPMRTGARPDGATAIALVDEEPIDEGPVAVASASSSSGSWFWPVPVLGTRRPVISDGWGSRRKNADGTTRPHLGADIMYRRRGPGDLEATFPPGSSNGTRHHFMPDAIPALAASDGIVRVARRGSRGHSVVILHPSCWATYYTHLDELEVRVGQAVAPGAPIGVIGHDPTDGRALKHLHFELWCDGTREGVVDPEPYLAAWNRLTIANWLPPGIRNGGLVYRSVGRPGEPYPDWLRRLKGESGVYVIRQEGKPVYVGESHSGKLVETLTRHFQRWRRQKSFWKGGYTEGHDPGMTYDRETVEVAVRVTTADEAIEEEARLIARLGPRDNLVGQPDADEVPF